jgi:peptide-methionine (R)-S-oxide reductase
MKQTVTIFALAAWTCLSACQPKTNSTVPTTVAMSETSNPRNPYYSRTDTTVLNVPDKTWKEVLPDSIYEVARNKDTERAFTGKYWNFEGIGTYYCAACGNKLFRSDAKFSSTCGWPSFFEVSRKNGVKEVDDNTHGMHRIEILCGRCGGHLGHLFDDGPPPTFKRYCMNSIVLDFEPELGSTTAK